MKAEQLIDDRLNEAANVITVKVERMAVFARRHPEAAVQSIKKLTIIKKFEEFKWLVKVGSRRYVLSLARNRQDWYLASGPPRPVKYLVISDLSVEDLPS